MWTRFYDMCSGGGRATEHGIIWINASKKDACQLFESIFERDPNNVTCECCGPDYSITEYENPEFEKNCYVIDSEMLDKWRR